jgi:hypothetical protein
MVKELLNILYETLMPGVHYLLHFKAETTATGSGYHPSHLLPGLASPAST